MPTKLSRSNIRVKIKKYLDKLKKLEGLALPSEPLKLFWKLKRDEVGVGPYPNCSIFEVANRVMSDLVVFGAVESLFETPPKIANQRIQKVIARLGNENGSDIEAKLAGGGAILGECFNVAKTHFLGKFNKTADSLRSKRATILLIAFNDDAHRDVRDFERRLRQREDKEHLIPIIIIPVNVDAFLKKWKC